MEKKYKAKMLDKSIYIEFFGDIDDSICPYYKEHIGELIRTNKNKDLVFDFKNVTFIDSSGIGFILARYNQLKTYKKKVYVTNTSEHIDKLFRISGIYTIINEYQKSKEEVK